MTETTAPTQPERLGITKRQAMELLRSLGVRICTRTLERWIAGGLLSVKRVTHQTVVLFRDEVEALARKPNPWE